MVNNNNTNTNNSFKRLLRSFVNFCRKFGPARAVLDTQNSRQLSFDSLKLIGNKKKQIEDINEDAGTMIKDYLDDVEGLLEFIERRGTKVVRCPYADKILATLGLMEGFNPPLKGLKGKILICGLKLFGRWPELIPKETPPMFIFTDKEPPMGYMVHQIHHWLSYNQGFPGYTEDALENFKRIFDPSFGVEDVKKMSKEEIVALREAIARDQAAIDFVDKMAQEIFKPQDVLKGMKEGDKKNI